MSAKAQIPQIATAQRRNDKKWNLFIDLFLINKKDTVIFGANKPLNIFLVRMTTQKFPKTKMSFSFGIVTVQKSCEKGKFLL